METMSFKGRLNEAFKAMRGMGLLARQNFKCCGNCAGYALAELVTAMPEAKRAKVRGACSYHSQDAAKMFPARRREWLDGRWVWTQEPAGTYLQYGQVDTQAHGPQGLPTEEVGKLVVQALEAAGLEVDWDGKASTRIWVQERRQLPAWQLGVAVTDAASLATGGVA